MTYLKALLVLYSLWWLVGAGGRERTPTRRNLLDKTKRWLPSNNPQKRRHQLPSNSQRTNRNPGRLTWVSSMISETHLKVISTTA
jgi:hypothetical protein